MKQGDRSTIPPRMRLSLLRDEIQQQEALLRHMRLRQSARHDLLDGVRGALRAGSLEDDSEAVSGGPDLSDMLERLKISMDAFAALEKEPVEAAVITQSMDKLLGIENTTEEKRRKRKLNRRAKKSVRDSAEHVDPAIENPGSALGFENKRTMERLSKLREAEQHSRKLLFEVLDRLEPLSASSAAGGKGADADAPQWLATPSESSTESSRGGSSPVKDSAEGSEHSVSLKLVSDPSSSSHLEEGRDSRNSANGECDQRRRSLNGEEEYSSDFESIDADDLLIDAQSSDGND